LEEEKVGVDAEVEVIDSYTPPRFVGESLSQVPDSGAAIPSSSSSSKCKTPFALDYVERLPIEQREQYASLKSIPKQGMLC
jgi:hypothetical protein